jgi:8-oxo-dGTP diphosphatase
MTDIVVSVTTRKDDNHVIVQRRLMTEPGLEWSFPGGKIELDETPAQAAIRELFQETAVIADPIAEIGHKQHPRDSSATLYYIHCEYKSGVAQVCEPDKHSDVRWVDRNDLPLLFGEFYSPFVRDFLVKPELNT